MLVLSISTMIKKTLGFPTFRVDWLYKDDVIEIVPALIVERWNENCDGDKEAYQRAISISQPCYYLEFKIVPNCNIHGNYKEESGSYKNPFIEFGSGTNEQG